MALTLKQRKFIDAYLGVSNGNATDAARRAGYAGTPESLRVVGCENLTNPNIREEIDRYYRENSMTPEEVIQRLADQAKGVGEYMAELGNGKAYVDLKRLLADGKGHLIKAVKYTNKGQCIIEFYDAQSALVNIGRHHKLFTDRVESDVNVSLSDARATLDGKLAQLAARADAPGVPE